MNPRCRKTFAAIVFLQSLLALFAWMLGIGLFLFLGPGIDAGKPNHQVSLAHRLWDTAVVSGPPVLWLTLAAILVWRKRELGWWLCVLGDLCVAGFGLVLLADDLSHLAEIRRHPALYDDFFYHLILVLLPSVGLVLLFSGSIRVISSAFRRGNGLGSPSDATAPR